MDGQKLVQSTIVRLHSLLDNMTMVNKMKTGIYQYQNSLSRTQIFNENGLYIGKWWKFINEEPKTISLRKRVLLRFPLLKNDTPTILILPTDNIFSFLFSGTSDERNETAKHYLLDTLLHPVPIHHHMFSKIQQQMLKCKEKYTLWISNLWINIRGRGKFYRCILGI